MSGLEQISGLRRRIPGPGMHSCYFPMFIFGQLSLWQPDRLWQPPDIRKWAVMPRILRCCWLYVQLRSSLFFNIDQVFPDPDPPITGENISSIRIFIPAGGSGLEIPGMNELEKEVRQSTLLDGTSLLGGVWTFMTGIFSLIFGSSLLLVAFGKSYL